MAQIPSLYYMVLIYQSRRVNMSVFAAVAEGMLSFLLAQFRMYSSNQSKWEELAA